VELRIGQVRGDQPIAVAAPDPVLQLFAQRLVPKDAGLHRRTVVSPQSVVAASVLAMVIILSTSFLHRPVQFLASLFSFGVLLAFTAAQLAVIRLRFTEPKRRRPFKVPLNVRFRGAEVPILAVPELERLGRKKEAAQVFDRAAAVSCVACLSVVAWCSILIPHRQHSRVSIRG